MKFNLFGYSFYIIKTKGIDDIMLDIWRDQGRVAAIRYYRQAMYDMGGDASLKTAVQKSKAMLEADPSLEYFRG